MEILIAIVWYLALLIPGNTYTYDDVYNVGYENATQVIDVLDNDLNNAMDFYNNNDPRDFGVVLAIPGYWDKEPKDYTRPYTYDPWEPDFRKKVDSTKKESK
jgi:hypothetical protein